ncbi:hypothetical protein WMY93_012093 [Mugilogobius chulae]|uniref:Gypsy retrotransposon integrase-like protein 1 n=1 Tax=Mugilogobius chulae TaxID=88201 RepID=A0AAW0P401_9GOBI
MFEGVSRLPRQMPVHIPPYSEMVVWTTIIDSPPGTPCTVVIEPLPNSDNEWCVGRTLATLSGGRVPVDYVTQILTQWRSPAPALARVTEVAVEDIQGANELILSQVEPDVVEVAVRRVGVCEPSDTNSHSAFQLQGEGLTEEQQQKMTRLLHKWSCVFSQHEEDFGRTNVVRHQIPTGTAPPSRERYRPVPPSLYSELQTLLRNMLENGVVRESSSPWAAPIVLVKKKDGSWRFCVDYRKLNALTHKDAYPLPRIEESLTGLKAAKYYSTLDLASGYWQVEMDPEDREKTAFTTPFGLYEFERMPFGLCNAPATFQRLMQRCLGSMVNDSLLIYLDDIVVFSADFDSHIEHLEEVFRRLSEHGLKLQPKKCSLFQRQVTYLGHVISEDGVATDPAKTAAVRDWPRPQTVRQVKSFLGFAGYYRRFIQGFSKIARPLHALTHNIGHEKLYTDASLEGLGAVLAQEQEGLQNRNADALSRLAGPLPTETAEVDRVVVATGETWEEDQAKDADLFQLRQWKEMHTTQPEVCSNMSQNMKKLLREWDKICLQDGVLGRWEEGTMGTSVFQVLVPSDRRMDIWNAYHRDMGHPSSERTLSTVRQRCYWPGMTQDIKKWTEECPHCVCNKVGPVGRAPLQTINTSYPFEVVGMDYLSLGRPEDRDQSAETTARAVYDNLIVTFGCPERILTDRGGAFESTLMHQLCKMYGCTKIEPLHTILRLSERSETELGVGATQWTWAIQ